MAIGRGRADVAAAFYATALKGVQEWSSARATTCSWSTRSATPAASARRWSDLRAHQVDGVIVATSGGYECIGVPAVFIDNVRRARRRRGRSDNARRARAVRVASTPRSRARGARPPRIAYVGPPRRSARAGRRRAPGASGSRLPRRRGRRGLALPPEYVRLQVCALAGGGARVHRRAACAARAADGDRRPAWTCSRSARCAGCATAARASGDVALVSFDEPVFADLLDPPVTSLDRHDREIGRRAARLLLDRARRRGRRRAAVGAGSADAARTPLLRLRGLTETRLAANLL
jgi:DNA-binding LacI/PurR family transcriptional regulator